MFCGVNCYIMLPGSEHLALHAVYPRGLVYSHIFPYISVDPAQYGIYPKLSLGKFLRLFRKIYTMKFFPMKKFEKSDDSKFHPCIGLWWLVTNAKKETINAT